MSAWIEVTVSRMTLRIACAADRQGNVQLTIVAAQVGGLGDRGTLGGSGTLAARGVIRADGGRCRVRRGDAAREDVNGECEAAGTL